MTTHPIVATLADVVQWARRRKHDAAARYLRPSWLPLRLRRPAREAPSMLAVLRTLALVSLLASCAPRTAVLDARHAQRTAEINARFEQMQRESDAEWMRVWDSIDQVRVLEVVVVFDETGEGGAAAAPVVTAARERARGCVQQPDPAACMESEQQRLADELGSTYSRADFVNMPKTASLEETERYAAASHNASVRAKVAELEAMVRKGLESSRARIDLDRRLALANAAIEHTAEVDAAERRRRERSRALADAARTIGDGFQQAAQVYGRSTDAPATRAREYRAEPGEPETGCTSDFQCGVGSACVKDNYSTRGVCMRSVNEFGAQTFDAPRTESVMPKAPSAADCTLGSCPIGFTCDLQSGACVQA